MPTIIVGSQEWMSANLDVDVYTDGSKIPCAHNKEEWVRYAKNKIGCYCYYDYQPEYGIMYGKLYNIYAIRQGVAPHCWRLPFRSDIDKLVAYLKTDVANKLKSKHSWSNNWAGQNISGLNVLASGCINTYGLFSYVGHRSYWWLMEEKAAKTPAKGIYFFVGSNNEYNYDQTEDFGFSVRCMRDLNRQPPRPCP